jgi:cytochrome c553
MFGYTVKQLSDWNKERGQGVSREDPSAVMTPISHNLNPSQIAAIAAYLSYQK